MEFFRRRLAHIDALPQLSMLGLAAGAFTGLVMLGFRWVVEFAGTLITGDNSENFEALSTGWHFLLPLTGAFLIGICLTRMNADDRRVGVVHVMERLSRHQGSMPLKNALVQFLGGSIALAAGLSGGREGPAIHLGAASSSLLGHAFELPNNSMRTLIACGTAAAIAASFNTPTAGVIFAMEVVMMEYTIASFIPVILASVTATVIARYALGNAATFAVPPLEMNSLFDIPFVVFAGFAIGVLAAAFITLVRLFAKLEHWPFWLRATAAGAITGCAALATPAVMGVGYDTVNQALVGELAWWTLVTIVIAKTIASAACFGLGLPVGMIGPTLVIGATFGGALGYAGSVLIPADASSQGFYAMLGMTAMMAAVLQAPLAALMAVVELTANPNIILPAMLIIVVATLTVSEVFKQRSLLITTLSVMGMEYPPDPTAQLLRRAGIASIMQREFVRLSGVVDIAEVRRALQTGPRWIVVEEDGQTLCLLNAADVENYIDGLPDDGELRLMELPAMRKDVADIDIRATLHEAVVIFEQSGVEALCIRRTSAPLIAPVVGVLTRDDFDDYTRFTARR